MSFFVRANKNLSDDISVEGRMTMKGEIVGQPIDLVSTSTLREGCEVNLSGATVDERSLGEHIMPETPPLDANGMKTNSLLVHSDVWWRRRTCCQPLDSDIDCSVPSGQERAPESTDGSEMQQYSIIDVVNQEDESIDQPCGDVPRETMFSEPGDDPMSQRRREFGAIGIGVDVDFEAEVRYLRGQIDSYRRNQKKIEDALRIKDQEIENLRCVVRQLSESRADALAARSDMAEKMCELQRELLRLSHVATLSREVSRENVELTKMARREATSAQFEVDTVKKDAALSLVSEQKLYVQNKELLRKVRQLEISGDARESRIVESY